MLFFRFSSDAVLLFADLQMTAQIVFQVKCKNSTLMYLFAENKQSSRNAATQKKKPEAECADDTQKLVIAKVLSQGLFF